MKTQSPDIELKGPEELSAIRRAGAVLAEVLKALAREVRPGVSTLELDEIARREILRAGARPAFLNYRGFPATLCVSVNEEVVHGIPKGDKILRKGDLVSLDLGCIWEGFYADAAVTVGAGQISPEAERLVEVTRGALDAGLETIREGARIGDYSHCVQEYVESRGMSVVREFVGHGIGRNLHENPPVPNFGAAGSGPRLVSGMVLALEPMVNLGGPAVRVLEDGWTAVTADGRLSAHFEHTVVVTEGKPEILTSVATG